MILWVLLFYVNTVSTTLVDLKDSGNAVIVLKNDLSQRETLLVDPTLLFGKHKKQASSHDSDNTDLSDIVRHIFGNKIEPEFKLWLNDTSRLVPSDHLNKSRVQSENRTVDLSAPWSPLLSGRSVIRKKTPKSLAWLMNYDSPNNSASLKDFKSLVPKNNTTLLPDVNSPKILENEVINNEISERGLLDKSSSLDPFISHDESASDDVSTNLSNYGSMKIPKKTKTIALDSQRSLNNDSGPSNLLIFLKRSKRQVGNKTEDLVGLPSWAGMPQGILRQAQMTTAHVKRKILSMMLQSLYSAQERLWPLGPIVRKYEHLTPYRMAFIFMKLDQLVHEGHSIYMYLQRQVINPEMTMTRRLQLYSQIMRRNVDVTYLVDYIMERVPRDQVVRIRQWVIRQEQQQILAKKVDWDRSLATRYIQRPEQ